jgi:chromosomal replication initiation ATPase DnaA
MSAYAIPGYDRTATAVDMIQHIVCTATGRPLKHTGRQDPFCKDRQFAMWLMRRHTKATLKAIAKHFGKKQTGTVLHACKTVANMIDTKDRDYYELIRHLDNQVALAKRAKMQTLNLNL